MVGVVENEKWKHLTKYLSKPWPPVYLRSYCVAWNHNGVHAMIVEEDDLKELIDEIHRNTLSQERGNIRLKVYEIEVRLVTAGNVYDVCKDLFGTEQV